MSALTDAAKNHFSLNPIFLLHPTTPINGTGLDSSKGTATFCIIQGTFSIEYFIKRELHLFGISGYFGWLLEETCYSQQLLFLSKISFSDLVQA